MGREPTPLIKEKKTQHIPYVRVKAVVSEQSGEVDDVVHMLVVVHLVGDENPPWIPAKSMSDVDGIQRFRK